MSYTYRFSHLIVSFIYHCHFISAYMLPVSDEKGIQSVIALLQQFPDIHFYEAIIWINLGKKFSG